MGVACITLIVVIIIQWLYINGMNKTIYQQKESIIELEDIIKDLQNVKEAIDKIKTKK
jgi:uncharacterized membrane-anchored protein YhcB (DUF1043 family)